MRKALLRSPTASAPHRALASVVARARSSRSLAPLPNRGTKYASMFLQPAVPDGRGRQAPVLYAITKVLDY